MKKITIIGNGAMALSIAQGLQKKDIEIEVVGRDKNKLHHFCKKVKCSYALLDGYEIEKKDIILAVKPYALQSVAQKLKGKANVIYSILAGSTIEQLKQIKSSFFIRAMPNVAASYNASTTILTGNSEYKTQAIELFSSIGKTFWVEDENQLDIATALTGCAPAFLALVAEAMGDAAVKCGMNRELASDLVANNFYSFAPLIASEHPALIKDKITSPGGATIEGVKALEQYGARFAFFRAVESAYAKLQK